MSTKNKFGALGVFAVSYLAFVYIPVLFLPLFSFNDSIYVAFPLKGFTMQWYYEAFQSDGLMSSLKNSFKVGVPVAILSTALGTLAAKAVTRYRMPGKAPVMSFIMTPLVVPGIIVGVALLIIANMIGVTLSLFTIAIAHVPMCAAFSMWIMISRLEGFDKSMEEASFDLGEGAWMTFWRVTFPLILPGIIASLLLTFTISFDEFILASFLGGSEPTLPVYMWSQLRFPNTLPRVLALGAMILVVSFVLVYFAEWFRRRGTQIKTSSGV
ncbi:MAG: ABC transporter permease [Rhodospirillales bacterium]|jgi:spermidine/putrescine transport system permease protein|nr:ABC transporter permease [Rhodospirillales bacterium]